MATSNIDSTIPLQVHAPEIFTRLNSMLAAKRQSQEVQQGAIDLNERKAVQGMLASGKDDTGQSILGDDGDPDPQKLIPAITRVAPTTGQQYIQAVQTTHANKIKLQSAAGALVGEQRDALSGIVRAHINNPDAKAADVSAALDAYADQNPAAVGAVHYAQKLLGHLDSVQPEQKAQFLTRLATELQPAGTAASQQQATLGQVDTGSGTQLIQSNPMAPGGVQPLGVVQKALRPGEQETVQTDQLGNQYVEIRDEKTGRVTGTKDVPRGTNNSGPAKFGAGEKQSIETQANENFKNVSSNRTAASLAPQQLDQINKALAISSTVSTGGGWTARRADLEAVVSSVVPGFASAKNDATKLQLLDKFSERIAADSARVLGANASTDAARDSIHRQNANIGYTPEAIQSVLEYAKSQTLAMQAKGNAQEKWLGDESKGGIVKAHEFETAWRQAYDPMIFQMEAAAETPDVIRKLVNGLSPKDAAELNKKRQQLRVLGALP